MQNKENLTKSETKLSVKMKKRKPYAFQVVGIKENYIRTFHRIIVKFGVKTLTTGKV